MIYITRLSNRGHRLYFSTEMSHLLHMLFKILLKTNLRKTSSYGCVTNKTNRQKKVSWPIDSSKFVFTNIWIVISHKNPVSVGLLLGLNTNLFVENLTFCSRQEFVDEKNLSCELINGHKISSYFDNCLIICHFSSKNK